MDINLSEGAVSLFPFLEIMTVLCPLYMLKCVLLRLAFFYTSYFHLSSKILLMKILLVFPLKQMGFTIRLYVEFNFFSWAAKFWNLLTGVQNTGSKFRQILIHPSEINILSVTPYCRIVFSTTRDQQSTSHFSFLYYTLYFSCHLCKLVQSYLPNHYTRLLFYRESVHKIRSFYFLSVLS